MLKAFIPWAALAVAVAIPMAVASTSALLQWREPIYIAAGFAGIAALSLLLIQPLLVGGYLPGLRKLRGRLVHRWLGAVLLILLMAHVGGLWITSPPDVVDALLLRSPTPFSLWGVIALWASIAAALLAVFRRRLRIPVRLWRFAHTFMTGWVVATSVAHTLLVDGTMGLLSKIMLCTLAVVATIWVIRDLRSWDL